MIGFETWRLQWPDTNYARYHELRLSGEVGDNHERNREGMIMIRIYDTDVWKEHMDFKPVLVRRVFGCYDPVLSH